MRDLVTQYGLQQIFKNVSITKKGDLYVSETPDLYGSGELVPDEDLGKKMVAALMIDHRTTFCSLFKLGSIGGTEAESRNNFATAALSYLFNSEERRVYRFIPKGNQTLDTIKEENYHRIGQVHRLHNHKDMRQFDLLIIEHDGQKAKEFLYDYNHTHAMPLSYYPDLKY